MNEFRVTVAVILMLLAAYIVVMNWVCVIISMRNKWQGIDKHHSTVPVVSLILAILANLLYPIHRLYRGKSIRGWFHFFFDSFRRRAKETFRPRNRG